MPQNLPPHETQEDNTEMKEDAHRLDVPESLYKYVTANRIDILQNGHVRFTQPSVLNDPFEMSADVTSVREENRDDYSFLKMVLNAAANFIRPKYGDSLGVLSLTERPDNLLMWAHYAGEHSGLLIEFDARHEFFDQRNSTDSLLRCLQPMRYSEERPAVGWKGYALALLTKSLQWKYEQEWRMIFPLEESNLEKEVNSVKIHLFEFPPECVRALYLGCRMESDKREAIVDLITSDKRYSHVLVQHARQDSNRYALKLTGKGSIHFGHAARALQDGDRQAAFESIDRAIALEPDNYEYLGIRGGMRLDEDPAAARADLERAVELNPFASDWWAQLSVVAHRQNDLQGAVAAIDEAIIHDRENPEFLWYRAGLKHEREQYGSAIMDLDRAIELKPNVAKYFSYRAGNHKKLGHNQQVRADLEHAIRLSPDVAKYRAMMGQFFGEHEDWAAAVSAYSDAIRLDPTQSDYYFERGRMHYVMRDLDAAISDLDEIISLSDDPAPFYGKRAELHLEMGNDAAAERDAARLKELDPKLFEELFPRPAD